MRSTAADEVIMANEPEGRFRSTIVGDLRLSRGEDGGGPGGIDPDPVPMLIELNLLYPGGLVAVREAFHELWYAATGREVPTRRARRADAARRDAPEGLEPITAKLYQCVLTRAEVSSLVALDEDLAARDEDRATTIFRVWPDYPLEPQIDRSAATVKADAAWRSYDATGKGVVWAVIDSGIQATHGHFADLEIFDEAHEQRPQGRTGGLHRDFSHLVRFGSERPEDAPSEKDGNPLVDGSGHGTHVAGIIAGSSRAADERGDLQIASSREPTDGGFVPRVHAGVLSGMAPKCELVSLKVMRPNPQGTAYVTSSAAVIRALDYVRAEVNVDAAVLRVHGVNMSLGCDWRPEDYAAGQSPLCQAITQLVATGVMVVVSAGNNGSRADGGSSTTSAALGSITEPAHTEDCVAVGSTHRDAPHAFGVTWTSSKGPTLDGRMKPDLVAPGEWVTSAAVGRLATEKGLPDGGTGTYAEQSGTSMAAPHVSGVVAAFLSARPEFVGRPRKVKDLLVGCATDLGRERYAQGSGLVDLMRMLANI